MEIINANLDFIFIQGDLRFQGAMTRTQSYWDRLATEVPSSTRENHYGWIGRLPKIREWLGERIVNNLSSREYTLKNRQFEETLGLKREDILDDQLGLFNMSLDMLGMQAKLWPDSLIVDLLQNGHTATAPYAAFDGQPFFSASHPVDVDDSSKGTYSNYSSTGMALTSANFNTVYNTMVGYLGEDGQPLGVVPDLLIVPPQLKLAALQILNATFTAPAAAAGQNAASTVQTNMLQGWADHIAHPYLANQATTWYLASTQFPIRPFIWQLREPISFTYRNSPTDDNVFKRREFQYGIDGRGNAGFSLPFLCYKAVA
jgi:phage major head subunit gpT-like protein